MILYKQLKTIEAFESLKHGDIVAVQFKNNMSNGSCPKKYQHFNVFHIAFIKKDTEEVILNRKENIYFNYRMYVEGRSNCIEADLLGFSE